MHYKMFVDDERFPVTDDWVIVRSSEEAIQYVVKHGIPHEMSLDHDLGCDDTAMKFLHEITDMVLLDGIAFPPDFVYNVHSQNPIGAGNIRGLLDQFIKYVKDEGLV